MIQRNSLLVLCVLAAIAGCDRPSSTTQPSGPSSPQTEPAQRIVSLSPAATDLLLAMGAEAQLVGVSTFDTDPRVAALPRVGDYENVDWERINSLAPEVMIVQGRNRLSSGFTERAKSMNITLHAAQIDRFTDIIVEAEQIGLAVGRPEAARKMWKALRERIEDVKSRVESKPKMRTLIVTNAEGLGVAGPDTYLDDLLGFAGGENVLGADRKGYGKIDGEILRSLAPEAIIQLLPGATPAQVDAANDVWKAMPDCPAVMNGRVYTFTQDWALSPNAHVDELTELIAARLHPEAK